MIKFWDTHIHLFPQPLFKAIWSWFTDYGWELPFAYWELDRYAAYLKETGMERGFLLTYAHKPDMSLALNEWAKDVCLNYPCFIPFACFHPQDSNLEQIMAMVLDDWQFAGIKLQLAVLQYAADAPELFPIYEAAWQRQKPVIIHTGTAPYPLGSPYLGLHHMEKVMAQWPDLKIVIPHLGLYELDQALALVEKYPNLYLDTSWVLGREELNLPLKRLADFIERHPKRFLYGSDFPILDRKPQHGLDMLQEMGLKEQTLANILKENARKLIE